MAFTANNIHTNVGPAKGVKSISASSTTNVFGDTFDMTHGPSTAARACRGLIADAVVTVTVVDAVGRTTTGLVLQPGVTPLQVMMVTSLSGGNLWALL